MAIIAEEFEFVVGVDTHARTHTFTAVHSATGAVVDTAAFPATSPGMDRAITWIRRRTGGERVFAAVEGTSSYGARLTQALLAANIEVGEVRPPTRSSRALTGKSDPIDAEAAARSVMGRPRGQVMEPRAAGTRSAIRILLASRSLLDHQRTANRNALTALLRGTDLGIDARASLRDAQITAIAAWRTSSNSTDPVIRIARAEAKRLALAVKDLTARLAENHKELAQLTEELAPGLQSVPGVGPVTAAIIICAYSHHGRIRSEAAFAALGGVAPRPASSGNTTRHRLNRSGDRQLNRAFDVIVRTRMSFDPDTKDYMTRSRATGKSNREIRRNLKRYVCRSIFRQLQTIMA
jgi:transposase